MDVEKDELIPMEDSTISAILQDIDKKLPKVPKKKLSREEMHTVRNTNGTGAFRLTAREADVRTVMVRNNDLNRLNVSDSKKCINLTQLVVIYF